MHDHDEKPRIAQLVGDAVTGRTTVLVSEDQLKTRFQGDLGSYVCGFDFEAGGSAAGVLMRSTGAGGAEVLRIASGLDDVISAIADLKTTAWCAARSVTAMHGALIACMSQSYLRSHRRLPGSDRTNRLRKKRIAKVVQWIRKGGDS